MSLPVITLLITISISQNFYLALGMIGALSIVRFRTPVRNPYDLILYFYLITVGITIGVKLEYAFLLFIFMLLAPIFIELASYILFKFSNSKIQINYSSEIALNKKDKIELQILIIDEKIDIMENKWYFKKISSLSSEKNGNDYEHNINLIFNKFDDAYNCQKEIYRDLKVKSSSII
jgi:hypothetical protein